MTGTSLLWLYSKFLANLVNQSWFFIEDFELDFVYWIKSMFLPGV